MENALIKGATRRQNFSEINKIAEREGIHSQTGVVEQVHRESDDRTNERTNAGGRWAARSSLKSLPDSFSPWPVAICKVQRRISQGSSYRVTVRAARRYDASMFSSTIPFALMIRLNDDFLDFLSVGKRDATIFHLLTHSLTYRTFFSMPTRKRSRGPTIRYEARRCCQMFADPSLAPSKSSRISKFLCSSDECCQRLRIVRTA